MAMVPLIGEGVSCGKFYDIAASRPYPRLTNLEQEITVTLQMLTPSFFSTNTSVATYAGMAFTLAGFPSSSQYTTVFDQYMIRQLEVWLEPVQTTEAGTQFNEVGSAIDLDDANVATSFTSIVDKQGSLVGLGAAGRYHKWAPHVAVAEYSGTFTSYGNIPATWIDSASPNVQHYGFKCYANPTPVAITYGLVTRAVVSFRAPGI